jgi:hypothetical protein
VTATPIYDAMWADARRRWYMYGFRPLNTWVAHDVWVGRGWNATPEQAARGAAVCALLDAQVARAAGEITDDTLEAYK